MNSDRIDAEKVLKEITDKNNAFAYECTKRIVAESAESDAYYSMLPDFAALLHDRSSYVRTRAFVLICSQARWDFQRKTEELFEDMMPLLSDQKPTVVRQCLNALYELVKYRPELKKKITEAVLSIDCSSYPDSMSPLIGKDIKQLLLYMEQTEKRDQ